MFPTARISGVPTFSLKGQRSRSQDVKNLNNLASSLLMGGSAGGLSRQATTAHWACAIVRSTLLSTSDPLSNGMDGHTMLMQTSVATFDTVRRELAGSLSNVTAHLSHLAQNRAVFHSVQEICIRKTWARNRL